jgi:hypothetical protein
MIALVHLVACSNVASLVLARAATRRRELGIRLCLGAPRGRIIMQSMSEPIVLAFIGAVAGLLCARWLTGLVTSMWFLSALDPGLDARIVGIVAIVAAATALLFGLTPALASARSDPIDVLRSASAAGVSNRKRDSAATIIVSQVAVSLILLAQSLLLVGKYRHEERVSLGFESARLVTRECKHNGPRRQNCRSSMRPPSPEPAPCLASLASPLPVRHHWSLAAGSKTSRPPTTSTHRTSRGRRHSPPSVRAISRRSVPA